MNDVMHYKRYSTPMREKDNQCSNSAKTLWSNLNVILLHGAEDRQNSPRDEILVRPTFSVPEPPDTLRSHGRIEVIYRV